MKALSVRQPWVWATIHAGKDIENRSWNTYLRETIAIHASGNLDRDAQFPEGIAQPAMDNLYRAAIIGLVDIVDVVRESSSQWFIGPFGFVLKNPRPLPKPLSCKGALGFWDVPLGTEKETKLQLSD